MPNAINSLHQLAREVEELRAIVDDQIGALERLRIVLHRGFVGRLKWLVLGR